MKELMLLDRRMQNMVENYVLDGEILGELVYLFTAFSDATRLKIVSALAITEMCVTDLSRVLNMNQTTVSHQLRLLKNIGIVACKRQGKIIFYSIKKPLLNDIILKGVEYLGY